MDSQKEIQNLKDQLSKFQKEKDALSLRSRNLDLELANMSKAQGNLYRFQEKVERLKTIYAQVAEVGHQFNQSLDFQVVVHSIERFLIDHLNFERCLLLWHDEDMTKLSCLSGAGYYGETKNQIQKLEIPLTDSTLEVFVKGEKRIIFNEQNQNPAILLLVQKFGLDECGIYSLGTDAQGKLKGLLVVGNCKANYQFHLRVTEDSEMDALFANITSQIVAAQNAVKFMETIQHESAQVKRLLNNMRQAVFSVDHEAKIVEPVSQFALGIFEDEIVNKNLFDTLFKDMDRGTEAFSQVESVFSTVFGADELQWMLMEDGLPRKIVYNSPKDPANKKSLKANFAPIWADDGALEKIMFVIEDITELEKLESEINEKQIRMRIIQEIAGTDISTISRGFFDRVDELYKRCEVLAPDFRKGGDTFGELMRNLHTIKGNSRMFGLTGISTAVHHGESRLLELKELMEKNEGLDTLDKNVSTVLHEIKEEVLRYGGVLASVFGIENAFAGEDARSSGGTTGERVRLVEIPEDNLNSLQALWTQLEEGKATLAEVKWALSRLSDVPILPELKRFHTMILEVAHTLGKKVEYQIEDPGVKMARNVLEQIRDAMTHLIRNGIDHGVEMPADRVQAGKPEAGTITIKCFEKDGKVNLLLEDDGRGIDPDKVASIAVKKGFIDPNNLPNMSKEEKMKVIFLPGFSSKDQATELSGRGVGMDFVSATIDGLGGELRIESDIGKGTRFTLIFNPYGAVGTA